MDALLDDTLRVRDARAHYLAANGLSEKGYEDNWVRLQAGPLPIYFPNTSARVEAVRLHDVHHPATGYATTWTGESEIGAWEIGSGCGRYHAAWLLNLFALAIGVVIAPRETFRAYLRGLRSENLYHLGLTDSMLDGSLGDLRRRLGLDHPVPEPTPANRIGFALWSVAGFVALAAALTLPTVGVVFLIRALVG